MWIKINFLKADTEYLILKRKYNKMKRTWKLIAKFGYINFDFSIQFMVIRVE